MCGSGRCWLHWKEQVLGSSFSGTAISLLLFIYFIQWNQCKAQWLSFKGKTEEVTQQCLTCGVIFWLLWWVGKAKDAGSNILYMRWKSRSWVFHFLGEWPNHSAIGAKAWETPLPHFCQDRIMGLMFKYLSGQRTAYCAWSVALWAFKDPDYTWNRFTNCIYVKNGSFQAATWIWKAKQDSAHTVLGNAVKLF